MYLPALTLQSSKFSQFDCPLFLFKSSISSCIKKENLGCLLAETIFRKSATMSSASQGNVIV